MNPAVLESMLTYCHFHQKEYILIKLFLKLKSNQGKYINGLPWMICFHNWNDSEMIFTSNGVTSESDWRFAICVTMMTWSNGKLFRVTGHLCGEFTGHRWIPRTKSVTRSFDVFFDQRLNKQLSKPWWGLWFETPSGPLWRHCNDQKIVSHGRPYMILSLTRYLCVALTHHCRQFNCDVNIRRFSFHAQMGEN